MKKTGIFSWIDYTVENADSIKDFYCNVLNRKAKPFNMDDYNDYSIFAPNDDSKAKTSTSLNNLLTLL